MTAAGEALERAGESVYTAVRDLDDGIDRMPAAEAWTGVSHKAAGAMFGRATDKASTFKHYSEAVARALSAGAGAIGTARTALLGHADEIDRGELWVNDMWVVLIKPARVSAEKAASLQAQAKSEQAEINLLQLALGAADEDAARSVQAGATTFGFAPPVNDAAGIFAATGVTPPADDVPNPSTPVGLNQQEVFRDNDMAQTVRESKEWETADGQYRRTLIMMDGSRHEIWEWNDFAPCVADDYYDKDGNEISNSFSQDKSRYDGTQFTSIQFPDGTEVTMTRTADGKTTGGVTTGDGRHGVLPDEFFTHPEITIAGGALTGLEKQAERGIPMLTPQSVENLGKAGKYGGPALGVATALYDTVTAKTFQDACLAAISGTAAIGGSYALGGLGAAGITALGSPEFAPIATGAGDVFGGWTFGYLGGIIGNVVCR
ncbi:hypothetical protein [Mycolicibacterium psychrotolerans]|uniref:hypothetical protein n=1 Tax=Mycolicibacterium psychrotolerans TaxID=216929 RepID=UPI001FECE9CB|nr:hypothetical protein [Mycolicibacterium psychrotolerans]